MDLKGAAQGCAALFCAAAKPLPTEKAVAVNLNGIYASNVKDKNK